MIKRIIIISVFVFLPLKSFAIENIISTLIVNDEIEQEIDIVMDKSQMYLPCKYFLDYFEIPYKENHVDKSLSFSNYSIKNNGIYQDGKSINCKTYFLKKCTSGVQNEYFVPAEFLSQITGKKITGDSNQLLAFMQTREKIIQKNEFDENPFLVQSSLPKIQAYEEITLPIQKGLISLDSIGVRNNMFSDSYSQIYRDNQSKTSSFNNNMQLSLKGRLNSGEYKLDFGTNSYTKNLFAFSGISPQYKNQYKNWDYLIGKVDPWDFAGTALSSDIMGVQFKEHINKDTSYKNIEGNVSSTSTIKVYINDDFSKELSTYGGYYTLKDLFYNQPVHKIKIIELLATGEEKEIFSKLLDRSRLVFHNLASLLHWKPLCEG